MIKALVILNAFWAGPMLTFPLPIVTAASVAFTVPTASAKGPNMAEEAYWVGVGGIHRKPYDLCQAGVAQSRVNGHVSADLIVQDYPNPPIGRYVAHAGDKIEAEAGRIDGKYQAIVKDLTTGAVLATGCRVPKGGAWQHAEWIAESRHQYHQPILVTSPVRFSHMSVQTTRGLAGFWTIWKEAGTDPTLSAYSSDIVFRHTR